MEETHPPEPESQGLNKIDLSQLANFSFGTQWTSIDQPGSREADREPARSGERGGPAARRDRRPSFRSHGGAGAESGGASGGRRMPERFAGRPERAAEGGIRADRLQGEQRSGPQRERAGQGGPQMWGDRGGRPVEHRPYVSPYFDIAFYPEDQAFLALTKAMRSSCRTYELFEIARLVLEKVERFVVVVQRKPQADGAPAGPLYISVPDGLPFETEEEVVQHVKNHHLGLFFDIQTVEAEPPKGNFQFVSRCGFTGRLLAPPNYHRYQQIIQQHHATHLPHIPFDRFKERLETVREPESIAAWLESMKTVTRYTSKLMPEGELPVVIDNIEEAKVHLLLRGRERVVRPAGSARFHAKMVEQLPGGEISRAIEGHLERQRRFPLDTANLLRGRLRREHFTIFKKGSKGISYVSSVKRKFRIPGQVFSESIDRLINYIEANPMVAAKDLPFRLLGFPMPEIPAQAAPQDGGMETPAPAVELEPEQQEALKKLNMDLRWLVTEGYVTEYVDGTLWAPPPQTPQQAHAAEKQEETDAAESAGPAAAPGTDTPAGDEGASVTAVAPESHADVEEASPERVVEATEEAAPPQAPSQPAAPASEPAAAEPPGEDPAAGREAAQS